MWDRLSSYQLSKSEVSADSSISQVSISVSHLLEKKLFTWQTTGVAFAVLCMGIMPAHSSRGYNWLFYNLAPYWAVGKLCWLRSKSPSAQIALELGAMPRTPFTGRASPSLTLTGEFKHPCLYIALVKFQVQLPFF